MCVFLSQDMGLATDIAKKNNSPLPLGEAAEALYGNSIRDQPELATRDFSSIYKYLKNETRGDNQ